MFSMLESSKCQHWVCTNSVISLPSDWIYKEINSTQTLCTGTEMDEAVDHDEMDL